jgi:hypothetical protein
VFLIETPHQGGGHGKRFCARLRQAATKASSLGEKALSAALLEEARVYSETPVIRARDIYEMVEEILCCNPSWTFGQVIGAIARFLAATESEIIRSYRRLRTIYDSTIRREIRLEHRRLKLIHPTQAGQARSRIIALESAMHRSATRKELR